MSAPFVGLGTNFAFQTGISPVTYTTLVGVQSVAFTGDKVSTEKTTNMLTTNGVDTYIAGTQEPGSVDVKGLYQPGDATLIALEAIRASGAVTSFLVTYPLSLGTAQFSGIVESITRSLPLDKPATLDIKIKVTGAIVAANG
ncbi:MAG TPA: phage tail tube protein [Burkholderiaceae bacterium]|jgi:hypothetical protein|nr:phage tail tube protein [Burkholderiaceae bacterium]